jgi:TolB-like protein/tetratricopeptide (TPR) repeat protein
MTASLVRFGDVEIDLRLREVRRGSAAVRLQEQPFQLLALMLDHPGDVVSRDDIRQRLWPDGTSVDFEHSVNAAIKRLRAVLGDDATRPRFVETLPRLGYRFIGQLEGATARDAEPAPSTPVLVRPRLVVLPFVNLTGAPMHEAFSDGFTEELIAQLGARFADRVGVLARTSAMLYKDVRRGAADIGETLRVDYLVEGSIRVAGNRVRITAQLIETRGETHLWAQSYERPLTDGLAVQTEVASQIAHELTREILPTAEPAAASQIPSAYEAYLTGRFHWHRPGLVGLRTAIAYYDQAIAQDPRFGRAHSSRARAYLSMAEYYAMEPLEALKVARPAAERALEIDGTDCDAWVVLAETRRALDWDTEGARAAYKQALTLNPSNEAAHRYYAWFLGVRKPDAHALAAADHAFSLDPLCISMQTAAADVHYLAGDYEGSLRRSRHVLAMEPDYERAMRSAAAALIQIGRGDEALAIFEALPEKTLSTASAAVKGCALAAAGQTDRARSIQRRLQKPAAGTVVSPYHLAALHAALGDADAAFDRLEGARQGRDPWIDAFAVDPRFAPLRCDARFSSLCERLRLVTPH